MAYIIMALDFLFGCHHNNLSRVFTISGHSYRVCCECGKEFGYSFNTMSIMARSPAQEVKSSSWEKRYANGL